MLARVGMSSTKSNLVFPCWMMHICVTTWAKRKRTLTLLPCLNWAQGKEVKPEPQYFPPSNDERSPKERHVRGGRKTRKRPISRREPRLQRAWETNIASLFCQSPGNGHTSRNV